MFRHGMTNQGCRCDSFVGSLCVLACLCVRLSSPLLAATFVQAQSGVVDLISSFSGGGSKIRCKTMSEENDAQHLPQRESVLIRKPTAMLQECIDAPQDDFSGFQFVMLEVDSVYDITDPCVL